MRIRIQQTLAAALVLAAGIVLAPPPAFSQNNQNQQGGGGDERTRGRRDIITRYINATNNVADLLAKMTETAAEGDVRQRLENAVQHIVQIKNVLKSDRMENSPQVQELLKEKHTEIAQASAKLATQVTRIKAMPNANPELLALLDKI